MRIQCGQPGRQGQRCERTRHVAAVLWALLLCSGTALAQATAAERGPAARAVGTTVDGTSARVIVRFRSDAAMQALATGASTTGAQRAGALSARLGLALQDGRAMGSLQQVMLSSGLTSEALAQQLSALPEVAYAVADRRRFATAVTPNDPLYANSTAAQTPAAGQWYLQASSSTWVSALGMPTAWALTTGSSGPVVAVLDTGVRLDHPDLAGKLLAGYDFVSDTDASNDGDGRDADPSDPGDWITSAENASGALKGCGTSDSSWHGTQTSGLVGATTDNAVGMASVGRDVQVLPVRVLGKCGGYDSDIIDAMRWAAGLSVTGLAVNPHPARVLNLSLGGSGSCGAAYQAAVDELTAAGVVVVAAAGNDGLAVNAPANCDGVIAVAGVRHSGTKVGYSSLGSQVKIAAPAGNCVNATGTCLYPILTTSNTGTTGPSTASYTSGGDDASLGTSFSSPLVAGTVALMLAAQPALTPAQVISLLQSSARAFPTSGAGSGVSSCHTPTAAAQTAECYCTTTTCGAGLLDAGAAVQAAAAVSVSSTTTTTSGDSTSSTDTSTGTSSSGTTSDSTSNSGGGAVDTGWLWLLAVAALAALRHTFPTFVDRRKDPT